MIKIIRPHILPILLLVVLSFEPVEAAEPIATVVRADTGAHVGELIMLLPPRDSAKENYDPNDCGNWVLRSPEGLLGFTRSLAEQRACLPLRPETAYFSDPDCKGIMLAALKNPAPEQAARLCPSGKTVCTEKTAILAAVAEGPPVPAGMPSSFKNPNEDCKKYLPTTDIMPFLESLRRVVTVDPDRLRGQICGSGLSCVVK